MYEFDSFIYTRRRTSETVSLKKVGIYERRARASFRRIPTYNSLDLSDSTHLRPNDC